jgi:hypothetical protein
MPPNMLHSSGMPSMSSQRAYGGQHQNLSPDSVMLQQQQQVVSNNMNMHYAPNGLSHSNDNMRNIVFLPTTEPLKDIYFNPLESPRANTGIHRSAELEQVLGCMSTYKNSTSPQRVNMNRRMPRGNKDDYRYEHQPSVSSLAVDKIFNGERRGMSSIKTALGSSTLSVMSLSIDGTNPESLGPLFNSSLRLSSHAGGRNHSKRTKDDGDSSSIYEKGTSSSIFEMSVNTLGDQLSEFGDSGVMRMTESQAEMSIGNVFEDSYTRGCR